MAGDNKIYPADVLFFSGFSFFKVGSYAKDSIEASSCDYEEVKAEDDGEDIKLERGEKAADAKGDAYE